MVEYREPIRIGVIGCGVQGRLHIEALSRLPGVEVVAVCDRDGARAADAVLTYGPPHHYVDHGEMLAEQGLDAVTVCTMPASHREIVLDALGADAHVLCEKPFATSAAEALEMVRASRSAQRLLTVGFNLRFSSAARAVEAFIAGGELGAAVCARGFMLADQVPWWGRHYVLAESGGGALNSTAVHMLDLLMALTDEWRPTTASASATRLFPRKRGETVPEHVRASEYDVEDLLFGHVRFASGFWLSIEGAWVWDQPGWNYSFELLGDRGQAELAPLRFSGERDGEIVTLWRDVEGDTDFPTSVGAELEHFIDCIATGQVPRVRAEQALVVQCVVDALYESARRGHEVDVVVPEEALVNVSAQSTSA